MFTRVTETIFRDDFQAIRPDNFTRAGLVALFDHLENLEDDTGEQIEFDVIGLCCDFTEYANWAEFHNDYGSLVEGKKDIICSYDGEKGEDCDCGCIADSENFEKLQDHTTVICFGESSFIIRAF